MHADRLPSENVIWQSMVLCVVNGPDDRQSHVGCRFGHGLRSAVDTRQVLSLLDTRANINFQETYLLQVFDALLHVSSTSIFDDLPICHINCSDAKKLISVLLTPKSIGEVSRFL